MGQICPQISRAKSNHQDEDKNALVFKSIVKSKILREEDKILIRELQEKCIKIKEAEESNSIKESKLVFNNDEITEEDEIIENVKENKTESPMGRRNSTFLERREMKMKNISEMNITSDETIQKIEPDSSKEIIKLPTFLKKMSEIKNLCQAHMIDPLYNHFVLHAGNENIFREKKTKSKINFFKENLIKSLKKNEHIINVFLAPLISESYGGINLESKNKEVFFKLQYESEIHLETEKKILKSLNFIGFQQKKYFYSSNDTVEKNPKLKNKKSIVIINHDAKLLSKKNYLGVKIFKNGKLFAGKFNNNGVLNGRGIYIDKKGNVFLCDFINSEIESALIYGSDSTIYKGKVLNYRKHGSAQTEYSESYEFVGDFDKGKKIKGVYNTKSSNSKKGDLLEESSVRSIELDEKNFKSLKKTIHSAKIDYTAKYLIKSFYDDCLMAYLGRVINGKLNDECLIYFDKGKMFPCFEGQLEDNQRLNGKYAWNENEFYQGKFRNSLFHNKNEKYLLDVDKENSIIKAYGREFDIICEKGRVTKLNDVRKLSNS